MAGTGPAVQQVACHGAGWLVAWLMLCCTPRAVRPTPRASRAFALRTGGRALLGCLAGHMPALILLRSCWPGRAGARHAACLQSMSHATSQPAPWHATCCTAGPVPATAPWHLARQMLHSRSRASHRALALGTPDAAQQVPCQPPRPGTWHARCCTAGPVPHASAFAEGVHCHRQASRATSKKPANNKRSLHF